jgi:hypothetical protein
LGQENWAIQRSVFADKLCWFGITIERLSPLVTALQAILINTSINHMEVHMPENQPTAFPDQPDTGKIYLAVVPIICRCIVAIDPARYDKFATAMIVKMNGMAIGDAEVLPQNYTSDGREMEVVLTGTLPIFTRKGLQAAIDRAKRSKIEISGAGMSGVARDAIIEVGEIVTLIDPWSGDSFVLHGANR